MNDNSLTTIPNVEDHAVPPAFTPPPPPPSINPTPPPPPPNKKPSKPKIIAAVIVGVVLVIGLAVGVFLNSRSEPTRVDTAAAPCSPVGIVEKYCDTSTGSEQEKYHTCGGDNQWIEDQGSGLSCSPCGSTSDPGDNSTCTNASPTGPGGGTISCQTIQDGQNPVRIQVNNGDSLDRTYQLQKCFCPGGELPCNACDFSLPSVLANSQKIEEQALPGSCGSIQLDVSPVGNEFNACFATFSTGVVCTTPRPVCTNLTLSSSTMSPGQSVTATSTSQDNATSFTFALYNIDHPSGDGSPSPICVTTGGDVTNIIGTCPSGTHHLIYSDPDTTLRTTGTRSLTYANIFVADQNNGDAIAQRVQINAYISEGGQTSAGTAVCAKGITVASVPTATPTIVPVTTCQQLEMYRASVRITPDQIRRGDTITLRGFASAVNTTVSQIRFRITLGGTAQTPVLVPATLQSGVYQAEHQITINSATTYSITIEPVSP